MSYILEALRKAEQERNPSQPGLTPAAPRSRLLDLSKFPELRSYRPLLVAGLCLGLSLTLTLSLLHRHHAAAPVTEAPKPVQTAATTLSPNSANSMQSLDQMVGNNPTTLDDLVESDASAETADSDSITNAGNSFSASDETPLSAATPAPPPEPVEAAPSEPSQEMPATTIEHVKLDAAPAPQVQRLSDMPVDYRATFPAISLDVHSYDKSAKKRFIMISGKRYNEGDTLPEGPHIAQIIQEGVVFDFHGEQVLFTNSH